MTETYVKCPACDHAVDITVIATANESLRTENERLKQVDADNEELRASTSGAYLQGLEQEIARLQVEAAATREALDWIALQPCEIDGETPCTERGDCITEYCWPCYCRTILKVTSAGCALRLRLRLAEKANIDLQAKYDELLKRCERWTIQQNISEDGGWEIDG